MAKITFKSVKLDRNIKAFEVVVPKDYIEDLTIRTTALIHIPKLPLEIKGYVGDFAKRKIQLNPSNANYNGTHTFISGIDIKTLCSKMSAFLQSNNFRSWTMRVVSCNLNVNDTIYSFALSKEKGRDKNFVMLQAIDGKPIGKDVTNLLKGDLKFAMPSVCTKVYKEVWECKN